MGYQKKSYKKFVATAATATLVATAIVPVASASFSDVEETHEFATYINGAVEAGYIKGYADGTFGINDNLKRSQVVIIIGRYLEGLGYTSEATTSPWSDVTDAEVIKYGNIVKDAEVFTGYADGTLNGAGFITRENMAVVLDRLAKTVTGTSLSDVATDIEDVEIADLATANADYQASIQALRDLGISTADNFNPKGNVKRGQFAKFIVTAVEKIDAIEVAPEVTAEDIAKEIEAVDATLPAVDSITADNAVAAKAAVEAAKTSITAIEAKIAEVELTEEEVAELNKAIEAVEAKYAAIVEAADKAIEAAKELAVESVSAINAKEVQIKFNKKVVKSTLTASTLNVKAAGSASVLGLDTSVAGNVGTAGITLGEDGKTVTLTLADGNLLTNATGYDVTVAADVGEESGKTLGEASTTTFQFNDTVKPTVSNISSVNGDVKIEFSEKLKAGAFQVIINGQAHSVTATSGEKSVTVSKSSFTGNSALEAGKTYSVIVAGAQDLANNAMDLYSGSVLYAVITDTVAPVVESVTAVSETAFEIKFSEKVTYTAGTPTAAELGLIVTDATGTAVTPNAISTKDGITFKVTVPNNTIYTTSNTAVLTVTNNGFKDVALNAGTAKTSSITLTKDVVAPKFVSSTFNTATGKIVLTFDEELAALAAGTAGSLNSAESQLTIVDNSTGSTVAVVGGALADIAAGDKTVTIDPVVANLTVGKSYTFYFATGAFTDNSTAANPTAAFNTAVTVGTVTSGKPVVTTVTPVAGAASTNVITVTFDKAVKGGTVAGSATDVANYKLNNNALPAGTLITKAAAGTTDVVTITLPSGIEASTAGILTVSGVQAATSTLTVDTVNFAVQLVDTKAPEITSAVVNTNGDLVLTFSENVNGTTTGTGVGTTPVAADFVVTVNEGQVATSALTVSPGTANNQVVIKVTGVSLATGTITVKATGTTTGKDAAGNSISTVNTVTATR